MPDLPISGLPAGAALTAADLFAGVQAGVTVSLTAAQLQAFITAAIGASIHPGYVQDGRYYSHATRSVAGVATVAHAANSIHYTPMQIWRDARIKEHGIKTGSTNAVTGNINAGIYTSVDGKPGTLLKTLATGVAVAASINLNVVISPIGGLYTLPAGAYWFAVQADAALNLTGQTNQSQDWAMVGGSNSASWFAATGALVGFTENAAYASGLPPTATPVASAAILTSGVLRTGP